VTHREEIQQNGGKPVSENPEEYHHRFKWLEGVLKGQAQIFGFFAILKGRAFSAKKLSQTLAS
jgi:hypothetical protein